MQPDQELEPYLLAELAPGEAIRYRARATDGTIAVSDRRLLIAASERLALSLPYSELRRIQFDIERGRPAALAFVPELPHHEPVMLTIPPEEYRAVGEALIAIAEHLFALDRAERATDGPVDGPTDGAPGHASNEDQPA
jgi:hypothetical protein